MRYICLIISRMLRFPRLHNLLLTLGCVALQAFALAQGFENHRLINLPEEDTSLTAIQARINSEIDAIEVSLVRTHLKQSPVGKHEQFDLMVNGTPVYSGMIKRNTLQNGQTTLSYPKFSAEQVHFPSFTEASTRAQVQPEYPTHRDRTEWIWFEGQWRIGRVLHQEMENDFLERILAPDGEEWYRRSLSFNNGPDSVVTASVFQPDPISSAEGEWGETFVDNDDQNYPALDAELIIDSIPVRWDSANAVWTLESDYARAIDHSAPAIAPPVSATGDFHFNRSESGFEYVMAHYHINEQQEHIQALGFPNLANYAIRIDAHGRDGADQSTFFPVVGNERIEFGDGGVDDAEDADVIIHEYGHALSFSAAPGSAIGSERLSIEEGLCDYLAISYSIAHSHHQCDWVFNWDGHNEYWEGRGLRPLATYPSDMDGLLYSDGLIWTTALADAHKYLGRTISDRLMLSSLYSYFPDMAMPDAARLFMQADTVLYDAAHCDALSIIFCARGLYPGCADTIPTGIPLDDPYLGGTEDFLYKDSPIRIFPNSRSLLLVQLFDLKGSLLMHWEMEELDDMTCALPEDVFIDLDVPTLRRGVYILRLNTNAGPYSFKIQKLYTE